MMLKHSNLCFSAHPRNGGLCHTLPHPISLTKQPSCFLMGSTSLLWERLRKQ